MSHVKRKASNPGRYRPAIAAVVLGGFAASGTAQDAAEAAAPAGAAQRGVVLEEVLVTAQRREQSAQDVPISMTVFSQEQLDSRNIVDANDLSTYTPSLQANTRFGPDATTFQIRGFTQELRTTSSVGIYFAEVVAPRGANTSSSGDGAGPGDFFDLANVQVLKGPQGTLFGRNTTGGAVLLTPQKPTDALEGYVELSAGNYDMRRAQAVVNIPVGERLRVRLGMDDQQREGHLQNHSGIGPGEFGNVDYTAFRASVVFDITDSLENYTILKIADSENDSVTSSLLACNPAGSFGSFCLADQARRQAAGADGFYDVWNNMAEPVSKLEQRQIINATTWEASDKLTVKNILSYASFDFWLENMVYGTNWLIPTGGGNREIIFAMAGLAEDAKQANSNTFVEELQLLGTALEDRLTWQAGMYYEKTKPGADYGSQNPALISCDRSTIRDPDPANWRCNDVVAAAAAASFMLPPLSGSAAGAPPGSMIYVGSMTSSPGGVTYENMAVFAQGTYDLTEQWAVTLGLRYTDDKTTGKVAETIAQFPGDLITGAFYAPDSVVVLNRSPETESSEPTGTLGVDYKPTENTMYYAKYTRGYRQGSVNLAGAQGFDTHDPEKVDSYEVGAKTRFTGSVPGTFNVSLFFNDFQDQQVQYGYRRADTGTGTTAVINAGESTIQGAELEANFFFTEVVQLMVSYTYLDTEVENLVAPNIPASVASPGTVSVSTAEGESLAYVAENQLVATASYHLPLDEQMGRMTAALTYVFNDEMSAASKAATPLTIDSYELFNVSLNWQSILGSRFDASAFVNNAADEEYVTFITGNWNQGIEMGQVGLPRMYGMRLRYSF